MSNDDAAVIDEETNTGILMRSSALVLGGIGVGASFFPEEILAYLDISPSSGAILLLSLFGAAYLGFAILNWMAREKLIGGIYSRPVAIGNFAHFLAGGIVLIKFLPSASSLVFFGPLAAVFALLAGAFGYVVFSRGGSCG